jgi:electron transfer flavoprotein beta subunit
MNAPHIIVCLKVVPRPEEVRIDPETLRLNRDVRSMINPADLQALEIALRLTDRHGGRLQVLSMGPPFVEEYLRLALAMGADDAYLLSDRAFGGADTLATSYTLACAVRRLGSAHLVVCGEESSDGATAQVPSGLAEWLGCAQVTSATELAFLDSGTRLWAKRSLPGGYEILDASLPAVVSVQAHATSPRFLDMERRSWADAAPVTVWGADDLDLDPEAIGMAGSPTVVAGTREAEQRDRRREMLTGTPAEQVRTLVERLGAGLVVDVPASQPGEGEGNGHRRPALIEVDAASLPAATTAERLPRSARAVHAVGSGS